VKVKEKLQKGASHALRKGETESQTRQKG